MPNWETVYYYLVGLCSQQTKLVFVFPASHSNCLKAPGFLSAVFAAMASASALRLAASALFIAPLELRVPMRVLASVPPMQR